MADRTARDRIDQVLARYYIAAQGKHHEVAGAILAALEAEGFTVAKLEQVGMLGRTVIRSWASTAPPAPSEADSEADSEANAEPQTFVYGEDSLGMWMQLEGDDRG